MDAQAVYMYQNNPNDQGSKGTPRPNNGGKGSNGSPGGNGGGSSFSFLFRTILIVVVALLGWYVFQFFMQNNNSNSSSNNVVEVPYSTFYNEVQNDNVQSVVFQGQDITGTFKKAVNVPDATSATKEGINFHLTQLPNGDPTLNALIIKHVPNFQTKPVQDNNLLFTILINLLPWLL